MTPEEAVTLYNVKYQQLFIDQCEAYCKENGYTPSYVKVGRWNFSDWPTIYRSKSNG